MAKSLRERRRQAKRVNIDSDDEEDDSHFSTPIENFESEQDDDDHEEEGQSEDDESYGSSSSDPKSQQRDLIPPSKVQSPAAHQGSLDRLCFLRICCLPLL